MKHLKKLISLLLLINISLIAQSPEENIKQIIDKLNQGESVENMTINFGDINFKPGATELEGQAKSYLDKVALLLKSATNIDLIIKGHTDNTGNDKLNNQIALDRASSVMDYLLKKNINPNRIVAKGLGSQNPIADNDTDAGRAANRRTELVVVKKQEVTTIQDIIVLRNGSQIGADIIDYNDNIVSYKQFSSNEEFSIKTVEVDKIILANGEIIDFKVKVEVKEPEPLPKVEKEKFDFQKWFKDNFNLFDESESFSNGDVIIAFGYGLKSNIGINQKNSKIQVPTLIFNAELPYKNNIGIGISAGVQRWKPKDNEASTLGYYTFSPKVAYHFNLGEKIDLYTGLSINGRLAVVKNSEPSTSLSNFKVDVGTFLGCRYYLKNTLGVFYEKGRDGVACNKLGIVFRL